jgi:hypothetical protein
MPASLHTLIVRGLILAGGIAALGACQTEPVRLYALREAPAGSSSRAAFERLTDATALANEFLETSTFARGFPAEGARFSLDHSDILITFKNEGVWPLRIETTGWADLRTAMGDGLHPTDRGFLATRRTDPGAAGDGTSDSSFLLLDPPEMAAQLLRQAAILREMRARGEFDFWLNYDLLGLNPQHGWRDGNVVTWRAFAVEDGFYQWYAERLAAEQPELAPAAALRAVPSSVGHRG